MYHAIGTLKCIRHLSKLKMYLHQCSVHFMQLQYHCRFSCFSFCSNCCCNHCFLVATTVSLVLCPFSRNNRYCLFQNSKQMTHIYITYNKGISVYIHKKIQYMRLWSLHSVNLGVHSYSNCCRQFSGCESRLTLTANLYAKCKLEQ